MEKSLGKIVGWMREKKKKHYARAGVSVVPFVMTAQGYLSREASDFIGLICSHMWRAMRPTSTGSADGSWVAFPFFFFDLLTACLSVNCLTR